MVLLMSRKKVFLSLISFVVMISLFASFVFAAPDEFRLSDVFETIQGFDIAEAYDRFPLIIDTIIYFLFFISMAQVTLGKQFEGSGGKGVVIAVGLALSIALTYWAQKTGFKLGSLGPLAALIFAIVIGIWIYRLLKGDQSMGAGIWISIIVIYVVMFMFFPEVISAFQENKFGRIAIALLSILFVIALPMSIVSIFKGKGGPSGNFKGILPSSNNGGGGWKWPKWLGGNKDPEEQLTADQKKEAELTKEEEKALKKILNEDILFLTTDIKVKAYIVKINNFILDHFQGFVGRRTDVLPKLQQVLEVVTNRENRDKKFKDKVGKNKRLLESISTLIKDESNAAKYEEFRQAQIKKGHPYVGDASRKKLLEGSNAKKKKRAEDIDNFLDIKILKEDEKRDGLLKEVEVALKNTIEEFEKTTPNSAEIKNHLDKAIGKLEDIITIDKDIAKTIKKMYKENRFVETILSAPTSSTGPTP